jgi:hypothetical protein
LRCDSPHLIGRARNRSSEEVGAGRRRAAVVGECRWTVKPLSDSILAALNDFKLPALRRSGLEPADEPETVLFSRSGFTDGLAQGAAGDPQLTLVSLDELVAGR